jgi:hypothetical protein
MTTYEMYDRMKPFLATTENYSRAARNAKSTRWIEFAPEEERPVKCLLPVKWVPPHKKLWNGWKRLTYMQFCDAYKLEMEPL